MTLKEIFERLQDYDRGVIDCEDFSLIGLSNAYLFCSYAYYMLDEALISDTAFDVLCKYLYDNWDFLEASGVREIGTLIVEGNLKAGTCIGVVWPRVIDELTKMLVHMKQQTRVELRDGAVVITAKDEEYDI